MDSKLLVTLHLIAVQLFVLLYLVKLVLLFTSKTKLDAFSKKIRVPEMMVSALFLLTGLWLFAVLGAIKTLQILKLALVLVSIPLAVAGYKNHNKALAILSFALLVSAYGISEAARSKPYRPAHVSIAGNIAAVNTEGIRGYLENCAMCHGQDGDKGYRGATLLSASKMDAGAAAAIIVAGIKKGSHGTMPAFGQVLNESQVGAIAAYIQGLKK